MEIGDEEGEDRIITGVIMGCLLDDLKALWVDNNG